MIYKRDGNHKTVIGYAELKKMYIQSGALEDEILAFRKKRVDYYRNQNSMKYERFMLFHLIPESFLSERKELFIMERIKNQHFQSVFAQAGIDSFSLPCVDGLRYVDTVGNREAIMYNSGIAEFVLPLSIYVYQNRQYEPCFASEDVWGYIENIAQGYQVLMPKIFGNQRFSLDNVGR